MRARPLLEMIFVFVLLLHNIAYGQLRAGPTEWRTFEVPELGTRVQLPPSIFTPAVKSERGNGQRFERADGRASLSVCSCPNDTGENPSTYLRHNLRMTRSSLDYDGVASHFSTSHRNEKS
jgi:hypothetical protein